MTRLLFFCLALLPTLVSAETIEGRARVVDGDTLDIHGEVIRLLDVDAFESAQTCTGQPCGKWAADFVGRMIGGRDVDCLGEERDAYGRLLAHCFIDKEDIGGALVANGLGVAYRKYSTAYVPIEDQARAAKRGVWAQGTPQMPWDYRAQRWNTAAQTTPDNCPIKGNINSKGERIYHTPYSRSYAATRITTSKGERWFCSAAEALSAGWRAPYR